MKNHLLYYIYELNPEAAVSLIVFLLPVCELCDYLLILSYLRDNWAN